MVRRVGRADEVLLGPFDSADQGEGLDAVPVEGDEPVVTTPVCPETSTINASAIGIEADERSRFR